MDFMFVKSQRKGQEDCGAITARYRRKGVLKKHSLGIVLKQKEWDKIRQVKYTHSSVLTSACMTYGQFAGMLVRIKEALDDKAVTPEIIPSVIRSIVSETRTGEAFSIAGFRQKRENLLTECMQQFIKDAEEGKRLKKRKSEKFSKGYISNFKSALMLIRTYEKASNTTIGLNDVTMNFQRAFCAFMHERGLAPNTIYSRMVSVRAVMEAAYLDKKTKCEDFKLPGFVPSQQEVDNIFLTPKQIDQLLALDLSSLKSVRSLYDGARFTKKRLALLPRIDEKVVRYLAYARDTFCVGCLCGQRVSDYSRIQKEMLTTIGGKRFIRLTQVKTKAKVYIPLDVRVLKILRRYDGKLPSISTYTMNKHLRLLGEFLHWTQKPDFEVSDVGSHKGKTRFCDMITTHTARRSFATNAYMAGVPLSSIMAVTGHVSERNLRRYLKLQAEDRAMMAAKDFSDFIQIEK